MSFLASHTAHQFRRHALTVALWSASAAVAAEPAAHALPQGGEVVAGSAQIVRSPAQLVIEQSSQRAVLDWQSFDIGRDASVHFDQPAVDSSTLNRISGSQSSIHGRITAPGEVILVNPAGVYFSPSAQVDVGALVATVNRLSLDDYLAGEMVFERGDASGAVVNEGEIKAALGGYIALLAPEVRNSGLLLAQQGSVAMASGDRIVLNFGPDNRLTGLTTDPTTLAAVIENRHAVRAPGGLIILSARGINQLTAALIQQSGTLDAAATALTMSERGGRILISADHVELAGESQTIAAGSHGGDGGQILIGGDWQGGSDAATRLLEAPGLLHQATQVTVASGALVNASGDGRGGGGAIVVWSDIANPSSSTAVHGTLLARGGRAGGDGGRIETSGGALSIEGLDIQAGPGPGGRHGEWLIDPYDYTIGASQAATISNELSNGVEVIVTTIANVAGYGSNGNNASTGNITVNSPITATAGNAPFSLIAQGNVSLFADITTRGNFSVQAGGYINQSGSTTATNGGSVVYWSWTNAGYDGYIRPGNIITDGGHVWMGGGPTLSSRVWNGLTVGSKYAFSGFDGIALRGDIDARSLADPASGGDIWLSGESSNGANADIAAEAATRYVRAGNGDITLAALSLVFENSTTGWDMQLLTTGVLSLAPDSGTAFWSGRDLNVTGTTSADLFQGSGILAGLDIHGMSTLGGLYLGTYGGSGGLHDTPYVVGSGAITRIQTPLSVAGPIHVVGSEIAVQAALTTTAADAAVVVKSVKYSQLQSAADITTNGGDVIVWTNTDNRSFSGGHNGYNHEIYVADGVDIQTNGGNIVLAGGADDGSNGGVAGDGIPDGFAYRGGDWADYAGVTLGTLFSAGSGISLRSGGGDIIIRGESAYGSSNRYPGLATQGRFAIDSGSGTVTIEGKSATGHGIEFDYGTNPDYVISSSSTSTDRPAISITGQSMGPTHYVGVLSGGTGGYLLQSLGESGGGIVIQGSSNSAVGSYGVNLNAPAYLLSRSGDITITSSGGNVDGSGLTLAKGVNIGSYLGAATTINGTAVGVASSDADITIDLNGAGASFYDTININTTGTFSYLTASDAFAASTFSYGDTLGGLVVGDSSGNSGSASLDVALTVNGPITVTAGAIASSAALSASGPVAMTGAGVAIAAPLTVTGAGADVLLKASQKVTIDTRANITTNGGDLIAWANAANHSFAAGSSSSEHGAMVGDEVTIQTSGGNIVIAGGADDGSNGGVAGDGIPDGYAYRAGSSYTRAGSIQLGEYGVQGNGLSLSSAGGDIILRGEAAYNNTGRRPAVTMQGRFSIDSGTGIIVIDGKNQTGYGVDFTREKIADYTVVSASPRTDVAAITITGSSALSGYTGVVMGYGAGSYLVQSTASSGGGISITGSGALVDGSTGVYAGKTGYILSASGPITITGSAGATATAGGDIELADGITVGANLAAATTINGLVVATGSSTADITFNLSATGHSASSPAKINTSGTFSYLTARSGFAASDFDFSSTLGGLVVGDSSGNTGAANFDAEVAVNGPITVTAGATTVGSALSTTSTSGGDISLTVSSLSGSGGISLADGRALTVTQSDSSTYAGVVSGSAATLTKQGVGTLALTGTSSYSGDTTIAAGALQLGDDTATGTINNSRIINNASLVFDFSQDTTIESDISGSGSMTLVARYGELKDWGSGDSLSNSSYETLVTGATVEEVIYRISAGLVHGSAHGANINGTAAGVNNKTFDPDTNTASFDLVYSNPGGALNYSKRLRVELRQSGADVEAKVDSAVAEYVEYPNSADLDEQSTRSYTGQMGYAASYAAEGYGLRSLDQNVQLTLAGNVGVGGAISLNNTTYTIDNGVGSAKVYAKAVLGIASGGALTLGSAGITVSGDIYGAAGYWLENDGQLNINVSSDWDYLGVIAGSGNLTKLGTAALGLSANNRYTGTTAVDQGSVVVSNSGGLGSTAGGTSVASGAVLDIKNSAIGAESVALTGTLATSSGSSSLAGAVTLGGDGTVDVDGTQLLVSGVISGSGYGLTKIGSGALLLSAANSYDGATDISAGSLVNGRNGALADATAVAVAAGADWDLAGYSEVVGSISGNGDIALGSATLTAGGDNSSTSFGGVISGSGGLTKAGSGTLILAGDNIYSGATAVTGGVLKLSGRIYCDSDCDASPEFGEPASAVITVAAGAVLDLPALGWSGSLGELYYSADNLVINGGTLRLSGSSAQTLVRGFTVGAAGATIDAVTADTLYTLTRHDFSGYQPVFNGTLTVIGAGDVATDHVISGSGGLIKNGTGSLTLNGASSYSGSTALNAGTTIVTNTTGLGSVSSGTVVGSGASLDLKNVAIGAENITFNGGALLNSSGSSSLAGSVTLGAGTAVNVSGTALSLNGVVSGSGYSLTKLGLGSLTLAATNTYSGATVVSGGTLVVTNSSGLGSTAGGTSVASGAVLDIKNSAIGTESVALTGTLATSSGSSSLAGSVTLGGDGTVDVDGTQLLVSGVISGSGYGLTKTGSGVLALAGTNSYSGVTTVSAGTLQLGDATATGTINNSAIVNNARVVVDLSVDHTIDSAMSGTGSLVINPYDNALIDVGSSSSLSTNWTLLASDMTVLEALLRLSGGQVHGDNVIAATSGTKLVATGAHDKQYDPVTGEASFYLRWNKTGAANAKAGGYTSQIKIELQQQGDNVRARAVGASYVSTDLTADSYLNLGVDDTLSDITAYTYAESGESDSGYGVRKLNMGAKIDFAGALTHTGGTTIGSRRTPAQATALNSFTSWSAPQVRATVALPAGGYEMPGDLVNNGNFIGAITSNYSLDGDISGSGDLMFVGSGKVTIEGDNSYTGDTYLLSDTLVVASSTALGTEAGVTVAAAAATIELGASVSVGEEVLQLAGATLSLPTGSADLAGAVELLADSTVDVAGSKLSLSGVVSGTSYALTKTGSGSLELSANSTYTGATTISAGQLVLSNNAPATASTGYSGAGELYIEPTSSSFSADFSTSGWVFGSSLGGLTIGKVGNAVQVTTEEIDIAGPLTVYGDDIVVNDAITIASGDITLVAAGALDNNAGEGALTVADGDRWVVYIGDRDGSDYGSLNSVNQPVWGETLSTLAPGSVAAGNRYVFSEGSVASITLTTKDINVTYGDSVELNNALDENYVLPYELIGRSGPAAEPGVYLATGSAATPVFSSLFTVLPTFSSANSAASSDAGSANITVTAGTLATGYAVTYQTGTAYGQLARDKAALTVTANDRSKVYGSSLTLGSSAFTSSGLKNSDEIDTVSFASSTGVAASASEHVGTYVDEIDVSSATGSNFNAANYSINYVAGDLVVTRKTVTVSGITASGKVYNTTTAAAVDAGDASGWIAGDDITVTATGSFADKNVGDGKTVTLSSSYSGSDKDNYTFVDQASTTANITAKSITVSGITASDKVYNTTTVAAIDTDDASGWIAGDDITVTATGSFADKNVGDGKTVTLSSSYSGSDKDNYTFVDQASTTANITAKSITVTGITAADKIYDGSRSAALSGAGLLTAGGSTADDGRYIDGDSVSLAGISTGLFVDRHTGADKVVNITGLSLVGSDGSNYQLSSIATTASISAKSIAVAGLAASDKVYDRNDVADITGTASLTAGGSLSDDGRYIDGDTVTVTGTAAGEFAGYRAGDGQNVSVSGLSLAGAHVDNYRLVPTLLTASITPKSIAATGLSVADKIYDGNAVANFSGTPMLVGGGSDASDGKYIDGDVLSLGGGVSAVFADKNVGAGKSATISGLSLSGADSGNYLLDSASPTSAAITAKPLTVSDLAVADRVYNGTLAAVVDSTDAVFSGIVDGDDVTVSATGLFNSKTVGVDKTVTLSNRFGGADAGNYLITGQTEARASITARDLTITGLAVANRVYDQSTVALVDASSLVMTGVVLGDDVSVVSSGQFADKNVGANRQVTLNNGFSGDDLANYTIIDQLVTQADILPRAITVSGITAASKVYDGTRSVVVDSSAAAGWLAGDDVVVTSAGLFADRNVGADKSVALTSEYAGLDTGNYTITDQTVALASITKATAIVAVRDSAKFVGLVDDSAFSGVSYIGLVGGDTSTGLIAGGELSIGTLVRAGSDERVKVDSDGRVAAYENELTASDWSATNYILEYAAGDYTIVPADALLVEFAPQVSTYGDRLIATVESAAYFNDSNDNDLVDPGEVVDIAGSSTSCSACSLDDGLGTSVAFDLAAVGETNSSGTASAVGGHRLVYDSFDLRGSNFTELVIVGDLVVNPKVVTVTGITADDKIYNSDNAAAIDVSSAAGWLIGDDVAVAATGQFADKNVGSDKTVSLASSYSGSDIGNYLFSDQATTTADITAKQVVVSGIAAADKVYDSTAAAVVDASSAAGWISGDDVAVTATGTFADKNAGSAKAVNLVSSYSGNDRGNYTFVDQATATATITAKTVNVTGMVAADKIYDGTTAVAIDASAASGWISGDDVTVSAVGSFADKNAGSGKAVALTSRYSGADSANYLFTDQVTTTADIAVKAITISGITAADKTYNSDTDAVIDVTNAGGWIAGDDVIVSSSGSFTDKNVGNAKTVTLTSSYSGSDIDNYRVTGQTETSADITAKAVTVTGIVAADKVYDSTTDVAVDASRASGWIAGDDVAVTAMGRFDDKRAGSAKMVALTSSYSGADASNYDFIGQASTTAAITAKQITVVGITAADKVYDATTVAFVDASAATGWIIGDDVTVTATGQFGDKHATSGKTVVLASRYSGADSANYLFTDQVTTTADIAVKAITISGITAADKTYNSDTDAVIDVSNASGWIAGDDFTVATAGTFADRAIGAFKVVNLVSRYEAQMLPTTRLSTS